VVYLQVLLQEQQKNIMVLLGQLEEFKYSKIGFSRCGTQTAALAFGGTPGTGATEEYNGTSWTAGGSLNTGRTQIGTAGYKQQL
jgi:hypothetical protein